VSPTGGSTRFRPKVRLCLIMRRLRYGTVWCDSGYLSRAQSDRPSPTNARRPRGIPVPPSGTT
jgi:hypothetical protein